MKNYNYMLPALFLLMLLILSKIPAPFTTAEGEFLAIESFLPPQGIFYPGDAVESTIEITNTGEGNQTFYVGYSLQDRAGKWFDIPAERTTLTKGESRHIRLTWIVPTETILTSGPYLVVMALWDRIPHEKGAQMLARVEAVDSLSIFNGLEEFSSFDSSIWKKDNHRLGYSKLHPNHVQVVDSQLHIIIPEGTLQGGGIASRKLYQYGRYEARIKLPDAPSSITGFFLYKAPDYHHEIDIEIYNDPRGEIFFTTYAHGERTHTSTHSLGFDPTEDFHVYRIDYYSCGVTFYVDDVAMAHWSDGLTHTPMYLMINTWFPKWLPGLPIEKEVRTLVDWIRY